MTKSFKSVRFTDETKSNDGNLNCSHHKYDDTSTYVRERHPKKIKSVANFSGSGNEIKTD